MSFRVGRRSYGHEGLVDMRSGFFGTGRSLRREFPGRRGTNLNEKTREDALRMIKTALSRLKGKVPSQTHFARSLREHELLGTPQFFHLRAVSPNQWIALVAQHKKEGNISFTNQSSSAKRLTSGQQAQLETHFGRLVRRGVKPGDYSRLARQFGIDGGSIRSRYLRFLKRIGKRK